MRVFLGPPTSALLLGRGLGPPFEEPPRRIVGVVGDVRDGLGLAQEPRPTVYVPLAQIADEMTGLTFAVTPLVWVVRTEVEPQVLSGPAEQRLQQVAGGLPVSDARVLRATVLESPEYRGFFAGWIAGTRSRVALVGGCSMEMEPDADRPTVGLVTVARHDCR